MYYYCVNIFMELLKYWKVLLKLMIKNEKEIKASVEQFSTNVALF